LQIKFEGKEYIIRQDMWDAMTKEAFNRGMTMDEYIAEAFTLLRKNDKKHANDEE
tara:strand:- start:318 stop:482 length:165 start_codon:yes stop_codon:yes gene_type:complete